MSRANMASKEQSFAVTTVAEIRSGGSAGPEFLMREYDRSDKFIHVWPDFFTSRRLQN